MVDIADESTDTELLAVHLHKGLDGRWYVVVKERDTDTGQVRNRLALKNGGRIEFDPSTKEGFVTFEEYL